MVPKGAKVCDVGTDHGYLPAALYLSGEVSSVIATDIHKKPLQNAENNLKKLHAEGVQLRLCDGLEAVSDNEVDTVIIAGMGGEVIAGILERAPWVKKDGITLILQAMTSAEALRDYLLAQGFVIHKEPTLVENNKVYSVILARFCGVVQNKTPEYSFIGEIDIKTQTGSIYALKQYKRLNGCVQSLAGIKEQKEQYEKYKSAADGIARLISENGLNALGTAEETNGI